ncbi:MAG: hypothetical protein PHC64_00265 [Candidatus Gastranaerophilales bacterium]|nr:hypothetical protein [Candidatus Gastranaerophilales bacterium]
MKKSFFAFTLAEILITLGIIGIVAQMTIPALIQDSQKKATAVSLKKAYSEMSQAVKLSEIDNGPAKEWSWGTYNTTYTQTDSFNQYWKPYFKVIKFCPHWRDCGYTENCGSGCFLYKTLLPAGGQCGLSVQSNESRNLFALSNGSIVFLVSYSLGAGPQTQEFIFVDLNGAKKPNTIGKDVFVFQISDIEGKGVIPYKVNETNLCQKDSTADDASYFCTARIMQDGWEITDDYPW